jgi:FixJ family two-component response regulator
MGSRAGKYATVHVVDDDAGMRKALGRILEAAGYGVKTYASAGEFLIAEKTDGPVCLLLDVRMPGPSGLELQTALARQGEALPVVFLTGHGDIPMTVRALKTGAVDFLTKPVDKQTLLSAIEAALAQNAALRVERDEIASLQARYEALSPREREVFAQVVTGKLNKQIAGDIGAAERTVKAHRAKVMEKMQAGSVADLVRMAGRLGTPVPTPAPKGNELGPKVQ